MQKQRVRKEGSRKAKSNRKKPKSRTIQIKRREAEKASRMTRSLRGIAEKRFKLKRKGHTEQIQQDRTRLEKIKMTRPRSVQPITNKATDTMRHQAKWSSAPCTSEGLKAYPISGL